MAQITLLGKPLNTFGNLPKVGALAPDFQLVNAKLDDLSLNYFSGKRKILSIVPSLDTPTCATSTRILEATAKNLENTFVLVISSDLPFAQARFRGAERINNVILLSTFRSNFAKDYGVELLDGVLRGLTARAVLVLDQNDQVLHSELVSELSNEPDYTSAVAALG